MLEKISELKQLINDLNLHTTLYEQGISDWSDEYWDKKYFELQTLEQELNIFYPNSPTQNIDSTYLKVSQLEKVSHNHDMLSLDKTKDINDFIKYFQDLEGDDTRVVLMPKLDGLTLSLTYQDGQLVRAETRGDGKIGEDVLHNAKVIPSIPSSIPYKNNLTVDGEIIITQENFKEFATAYKNPRNLAAGSIRLLDPKECASRNLTFIVWNIVKGLDDIENNNSFINKILAIKNLGFITPPFKLSTLLTYALDLITIQQTSYQLGYPIDGIVGRFNNIAFGEKLGSTRHHSRAAYALKFTDDTIETQLLDITYDVSRYGEMTPVAIFSPIQIEGTEVSRASLHNISILKEKLKQPFKGQTIYVSKRNQIIPYIEYADVLSQPLEPILPPTICPYCGQSLTLETEGDVKRLYCNNLNCNGRVINRINNYCSKKGMDIKGLSKATLDKLIALGWITSYSDIYLLNNYKQQWMQQPGFGEKSVNKILNSIEKSKQCYLWQFLAAISIPNIGINKAKDLVKYFPTWELFIKAVEDDDYTFSTLPNFGIELSNKIKTFDYSEAKTIVPLLTFISDEESEDVVQTLQDINIVITGKLINYKNRTELKNQIEKLGGKVSSSISQKTNYLINNNPQSTSAKNKTAIKLKIPILTEQEFIEKFLDN